MEKELEIPSSQNLQESQNPEQESQNPEKNNLEQELQSQKEKEQELQSQKEKEKEFLKDLVEYIKEITGYSFKNTNLLLEAFTDSSLKEEYGLSYERLEYVGDSVLNLMIATHLYYLYPDLLPGKLTRLRAANVDTEKLARVALKYNLHQYLRHKKPLLSKQIEDFKDAIVEYPLHSTGLVDVPKVLADIVEALIGAIYLDSDSQIDTPCQVMKILLQPIISPSTLETHPVTKLYEICQKKGLKIRFVDLWRERGEIEVYVDDVFVGKGMYNSKRMIAINRAANNAYNNMQLTLVDDLVDDCTVKVDDDLVDECNTKSML